MRTVCMPTVPLELVHRLCLCLCLLCLFPLEPLPSGPSGGEGRRRRRRRRRGPLLCHCWSQLNSSAHHDHRPLLSALPLVRVTTGWEIKAFMMVNTKLVNNFGYTYLGLWHGELRQPHCTGSGNCGCQCRSAAGPTVGCQCLSDPAGPTAVGEWPGILVVRSTSTT